MRAIAIPFVSQPKATAAPSIQHGVHALVRIVLVAFDSFVPPHDPAREPDPPPEWYRFPPF